MGARRKQACTDDVCSILGILDPILPVPPSLPLSADVIFTSSRRGEAKALRHAREQCRLCLLLCHKSSPASLSLPHRCQSCPAKDVCLSVCWSECVMVCDAARRGRRNFRFFLSIFNGGTAQCHTPQHTDIVWQAENWLALRLIVRENARKGSST